MSEWRVRHAVLGDGAGCAGAWLDAGRYYQAVDPNVTQEPAAEGLAEWFERGLGGQDDNQLRLVAEFDGEVVGFVGATFEPAFPDAHWQLQSDLRWPRLTISALVVAEEYRRHGIGTALMEAAERWGEVRGARVAVTDTDLRSPTSVPFYEERMGYTRRAVIFRKSLHGPWQGT